MLFPKCMILPLTTLSLRESLDHCKQLNIKVMAQSGCHSDELKLSSDREFLFQHLLNGIFNLYLMFFLLPLFLINYLIQ